MTAVTQPRDPANPRTSASSTLAAAVPASLVATVAMALTLMAISEISAVATPRPGVLSSTWTPLTGIASFVLGMDALHGSFHVGAIAFGLAVHLAVGLALGTIGVALLLVVQGPLPGPVGAALQGLAYGIFVEVFFLNLVVGALQDVHTVYESLPQWGWWIAHAVWGIALGLSASAMLARGRRE